MKSGIVLFSDFRNRAPYVVGKCSHRGLRSIALLVRE